MRWLVATTGLLLSVPALAVNVRDWSAYADALLDHMAIAFICRNEIGDASYNAARTLAADSLAPYAGREEAYARVQELDAKFKADARVKTIKRTAAQCFSAKSDAVLRINVEKAMLEAE